MANTSRVSRSIPQPNVDTIDASTRGGRYGEQYTLPLHGAKHALADEGSYFVATNATIGTAVVITQSITVFAETAGALGGILYLKNTESKTAAAPKRIYLDYIKLLCTIVLTASTSTQYALVLDDNPVRYTSGGAAPTIVNPNGDSSTTTIASAYFGALTTAVPNNRRTVGRGTLRGVVTTTFDTLVIVSGGREGGGSFVSAAASGRFVDSVPPIIIAPQQNLLMSMWGASYAGAGATFEYEIGWWER